MWIRRSFGNDPLYQTVVQAYIDTLLQEGFNFECFIEGGRSRTGKLLGPKFGILSFIVDSVLSGRVEDTIICPVSTQYDKVVETEYELPWSDLNSSTLMQRQIVYQRTFGPAQAERKLSRSSFFLLSLVPEARTRGCSIP